MIHTFSNATSTIYSGQAWIQKVESRTDLEIISWCRQYLPIVCKLFLPGLKTWRNFKRLFLQLLPLVWPLNSILPSHCQFSINNLMSFNYKFSFSEQFGVQDRLLQWEEDLNASSTLLLKIFALNPPCSPH